MNSLIRDELLLMMNVFGDIKDIEQIKIVSACAKMLSCEPYMEMSKNDLSNIINSPDFNIECDLPSLLLELVRLNEKFAFYKELSEQRMKIILYGVLYGVLLQCGKSILEKIEVSKLRLIYFNSLQLILMCPDKIKFSKDSCLNDICCGFFGRSKNKV